MFGLFGNLDLVELVVIAGGAVLVFGRNLPEVTMRGVAQVMKLRRAVTQMWREAGIEDELRRVRWDIEREARELKSAATLDQPVATTETPRVPDYQINERENLEAEPLTTPPRPWIAESSDQETCEEEARAQRGHDEGGHNEEGSETPPGTADGDVAREE